MTLSKGAIGRIATVLTLIALSSSQMGASNALSDSFDKSEDIQNVHGSSNAQVPPYLEIGDILFCEWEYYNADPGWDHVAIYIGDNRFIEATAAGDGSVRVIELDWLTRYTKAICYGQVHTATMPQRLAAVAFAQSQLGKPYQYLDFSKLMMNRSKNPSPTSKAWYCTELVWAAYYHQKINLDLKGVYPVDLKNK